MMRDAVLSDSPDPGPTSTSPDLSINVRRRAGRAGLGLDGAPPDLRIFFKDGAPTAETIVHRFGVTLAEAEDIRQDAFEAMLRMTEPIRSPLAFFWETAERRKRRLLTWKARAKGHEPAVDMLTQQRSPFPAPDAALLQRDRERAVEEVLSHVKPSRRPVVELRLAGCSETAIAEELKRPVGTVESQWSRAKREAKSQWAALLAALTALGLWLFARGRARDDAPTGGRPRRARAFFACAALSFAVSAHTSAEPSLLEMDTPGIEVASSTALSEAWLSFAPRLTTHAEREKEASPPRGRVRRDAMPSSAPGSNHRMESARAHLAAVHRAIWVQSDRGIARDLLDLYELAFPEDPFPRKHAELVAALNAP